MIAVRCFNGRKVALFGLGGSGLSTARALAAGGAEVAAWDDSSESRERARAAGIPLVDLAAADWRGYASFVLAPGVPLTHPKPHWTVALAKAAGVEIIGDIELFCRERAAAAPRARFIAVTGANGKSTTTALIGHILREAGFDVQMGGNIGVPILELAPPSEDSIYVIECSSFQIDLAPSLNPSIGALLNITPDHLDRHGTFENYAAIKERLVARADLALIGVDDAPCRAIASRLLANEARGGRPRVVAISALPSPASDIFVEDHRIVERGAEGMMTTLDLRGAPALRGIHNGQNAAFAFAAARAIGISPDGIARGLATFSGLAHRMEQVGRLGRVLFVNDSKATNADAAEKALLSFEDIFWIAGGKAKDGGIEPLRALFPRIAKAYLIGAASEEFARTLNAGVPFERCETLDVAVAAAARDAQASAAAEPVVLLSPACASYDQFANFEQRGDRFRALVAQWIEARVDPRQAMSKTQGAAHDFAR
jgi:UDP-N-acetylmuramoylalanine--D-glutamate ligase